MERNRGHVLMISNTRELATTIDRVITSKGFVQGPAKGGRKTWYKRFPETILVLDLQKSDFGGKYFINLAIGASSLLHEDFPREEHCHVRLRVEEVLPDHDKQLTRALDLEDTTMVEEERKRWLELLVVKGVEWLEQFKIVQALSDSIRSDEKLRSRTYVALKRHLGIECD